MLDTASIDLNVSAKAEILSSERFGAFGRYRADQFRTRFGTIVWMVFDADRVDAHTGAAALLRMEGSREAAVLGLDDTSAEDAFFAASAED